MKKVLYCIFAFTLFLMSVITVNADDRVMLKVTTEGSGQIKVVYEGDDIYYSKVHPVTLSTHKTSIGTRYTAGAKADEGYVFTKWMLDGEEYSKENPVTIAVTRNMNLVAVFEEETEENKVKEDKTKPESNQNNLPLYIGIGIIVVLLIAIVGVLLNRKK